MAGSRVTGALAVVLFAGFTIAGPAVIIERRASSGNTGTTGKTSGAADAPLVTMRNLKFDPSTLTVKRGTKVRFENKDIAPHTVTITGKSDSGIIGPGLAYELTVTEPVDYVCTVHPAMKATIELTG